MKRYKSSDLSTKARAEIIKEAKANGVIIECRNTNGEVIDELVLCKLGKQKEASEVFYVEGSLSVDDSMAVGCFKRDES